MTVVVESPARRRTAWLDSSRCSAPEFASVDFMSDGRVKVAEALAVCSTCAVTRACATAALELAVSPIIKNDPESTVLVGVWGGVYIPWSGSRRADAIAQLWDIATTP